MAPNYDKTVSVIEIEGFKQVEKIPVGINLHHIKADAYGKLWVTSRGDYEGISSKLFVLDKKFDAMRCRLQIRSTYLALTFVSVVTRCIIMPRSE